jgi:hypothetical protein
MTSPDLPRAVWRTSKRSGGNCVEVAGNLPDVVAVRDSKDREGTDLIFTRADWAAFTARMRTAALDLR